MEDQRVVLGIDPGLATIGYAIVSGTRDQFALDDFGVITTPAGMDFAERLHIIAVDVTSLLEQHQPTVACVEELFFSVNSKTALDVAHARGVLLESIARFGLNPRPITPNQVKQTVTGDGSADKRQIQEMVRLHFNLQSVPKPDDAADAIAIAYCGLQSTSIEGR